MQIRLEYVCEGGRVRRTTQCNACEIPYIEVLFLDLNEKGSAGVMHKTRIDEGCSHAILGTLSSPRSNDKYLQKAKSIREKFLYQD